MTTRHLGVLFAPQPLPQGTKERETRCDFEFIPYYYLLEARAFPSFVGKDATRRVSARAKKQEGAIVHTSEGNQRQFL